MGLSCASSFWQNTAHSLMHLSYLARVGLAPLPILALRDAPLHAPLELLELRRARLVPSDGLPALLQAPVQLLLRALHVRALRLAQKRGFLPIGPGGEEGEREGGHAGARSRGSTAIVARDAGTTSARRRTCWGRKTLWSSSSITAVSFA